jgi:multidrug resistance efflux pump
MTKLYTVLKDEINLPILVIIFGCLIGIYHLFSFLIPFTNNAFVATNTSPIAADVSGYITEIYVKNGQAVKKNDPIIKVYQEPYRLAYEYAKAKHEEAIEHIKVIERKTNKTRELLHAANLDYKRLALIYNTKHNHKVRQAVPALEVKTLNYQQLALERTRNSLQKQIEVEDQEIAKQKKRVIALKAAMDNALVNLNLTIVRAPSDGVVDNMYITTGTPIKIHEPLFSFIDTSTWWIQANFNETDLRLIQPGDHALIMLRMYYFTHIFHGEIVNTMWAANRQNTSQRTQQQDVANTHEWVLVPQRLPLQIKINDPDPNYLLHPGASAYVYLQSNTHNRNV